MIHHNSAAVQKSISEAVLRRVEESEKFVRTVAIQALADAQRISPVDTGLYRSAHYLTIRRPSFTAQSGDAARRRLSARSKASAASLEAISATGGREGDDFMVHLVNPLIYAWPLENGHSLQAPQGIYTIVRALAAARLKRGPGAKFDLDSNAVTGAATGADGEGTTE